MRRGLPLPTPLLLFLQIYIFLISSSLTVISLSKVAPPLFCDRIKMDTNDIEIMKFHTSIVVEGDNHDTIKIGGFFCQN